MDRPSGPIPTTRYYSELNTNEPSSPGKTRGSTNAYYAGTKPIWTACILCDSNSVTFWKRQNYGDSHVVHGCPAGGARGGWTPKAQRDFRAVKRLWVRVITYWEAQHGEWTLMSTTDSEWRRCFGLDSSFVSSGPSGGRGWACWGLGYTSFCTFASLCCEPKTTQKTAQVKISLFLLNGSRGNAIFYPLTTYFLTSKYLITHLKLSRSTALTYLWNNFIPKLLKILPTWHCMPKTAFGLFYFQETPPVLQGTGSIISKVCVQYDIKT